jgi:KDO2-lipid IV(A) lauroyltransferase
MVELLAALNNLGRYLRPPHVEIRGGAMVQEHLRSGRGAVIAIAHLGNWELAGLAASAEGYPLVSVARPLENPYVNAYLMNVRGLTGQRILLKRGSVREMIRTLREGGLLVILGDQRMRDGLIVPFLGRPALTARTPATLSLRCEVPVFPVEIYRSEGRPSVHVMSVSSPIRPEGFSGRADAIEAMTIAINERLGEFVRAHPDQWLWMHRRWKL